jgi:glycine dehydrogenase
VDEHFACNNWHCVRIHQGRKVFVVDEAVHPQTIAVVKTRAEPFGIEVRVCDASAYNYSAKDACGVLVQYPDSMLASQCLWSSFFKQCLCADPQLSIAGTNESACRSAYGRVKDWRSVVAIARESGTLAVVSSDLLALTKLSPPGEWGADIAIGNSQRFGVPMGYVAGLSWEHLRASTNTSQY